MHWETPTGATRWGRQERNRDSWHLQRIALDQYHRERHIETQMDLADCRSARGWEGHCQTDNSIKYCCMCQQYSC